MRNRAHNISSKKKHYLPTNATLNTSNLNTSKTDDKYKIKISNKISNRDGLNSQPAENPSSMFKNHLNLKIEQNKPSMHTVGENIFKKYKTPSFVSPNSSKQTEKIPSISETTSSKLTSNNEQIVGSSMIEKTYNYIWERSWKYW